MRYNDDVNGNLRERLRSTMSIAEWDLLMDVAQVASQLRLPLYVVGGLPRDAILGLPSSDLDLVVEGSAQTLAERLAKLYGGKVTVHSRFGTAKWDMRGTKFDSRKPELPHQARPGDALDLVTARAETYKHAGALPTVKPGSIDDDLARRDFTINALAIRLDGSHLGELRDDFGGLEDIRRGTIRVLHEASFVDDPTRMCRAVRYEQRYAFRIAAETLDLIPGARELVAALSSQRIRRELDLILHESRADLMLARLSDLDLLKPIHPDLGFDEEAGRRLGRVEESPPTRAPEWHASGLRWLLWLMPLPGNQIRSLNRRLHFRGELLAALLAASKLWGELGLLSGLSPFQYVERLADAPLVAVTAVYLGAEPGPAKDALQQYLATWRHLKPKTTGHDLKRLGLEPGPQYKAILNELRRAWLDGRVSSGQQEEDYLLHLLERTRAKTHK